jgi:hypothetical protein
MIRDEFNFELIPCPRCEGQGWLFPWKIKAGKTVLSCDECDATWLVGEEISKQNFKDLLEYVLSLYPDGYFPDRNDVHKEIEELPHETILEHVDGFGGFPKEANDFFVYLSNVFFICECKMSEACFLEFIIKYTDFPQINLINPFVSKNHTRIIRYNFRFFGDYKFFIQTPPNIVQYSHIVTQGVSQIYRSAWGMRFRHIVYDITEKKFYLYQIRGIKGNYFFDEATILHNIFYPDHEI